ncbi:MULTISPECIES: tRNA (adenosine(37)-N6)-threonylcarbamoyltransferase complex ATPase subunit type 1 TsaE [unclassified Arthrobacter]|uniref:tRNA (adenosine(37)-N6)-threonylcarbamoyltransferase complex ATPase subunit type 1 TsaE n=1 Tax=unclassified Arthrobacter TaxID=235627 RepID=UPI002DFDB5A7|nr:MULTISPECIES: tRNA (adenosine(37)-N6)-threonylcarbamoyltransferase complex ATPase subunit type 1 TsaE [unclassified Arthrobacter]MEC5190189.1 tRNA threonylcarbamoyladenosine biosynthesis protein TsaE [Arthrobacter sp. MP_M4]MEC5201657.1 tRNA threonylcarbamoyladenosine biosynthesis protein TsaE [Arthrobacter sp. MP_M7]
MSAAAWKRTLEVGTAEETHALAAVLGTQLRAGDLLVLTGELGAGKTTFTQGLGEGLGVRAGIISPTFVLVRIHPNLPDGPRPGGPDLVHVDAYRLGSASEIDDIDLENTLDSAVTVVEWGRGRVEHLSESWLEIDLVRSMGGSASAPASNAAAGNAAEPGTLDFDTGDDDEPRTVVIRGFGPRWVHPPLLPAASTPVLPATRETPSLTLPQIPEVT